MPRKTCRTAHPTGFVLQIVVNVPFQQPIFHTHPLISIEWLIVLGLAQTLANAEELTNQ